MADVDNGTDLTAGSRQGAEAALTKFRSFVREIRFSHGGAYDGGPRFMALTRLLETVLRCPLPVEPVGMGALWEAQSVVDDLREPLTETTRYELQALPDEGWEVRFQGTGVRSDFDSARIRKGGEVVRAIERRWTSTGSMSRHLRTVCPVWFRQESKWEAVDHVWRGNKSTREQWSIGEKVFADAQMVDADGAR
jgi:hypothetical protein